jgi:hypothetical protein
VRVSVLRLTDAIRRGVTYSRAEMLSALGVLQAALELRRADEALMRALDVLGEGESWSLRADMAARDRESAEARFERLLGELEP